MGIEIINRNSSFKPDYISMGKPDQIKVREFPGSGAGKISGEAVKDRFFIDDAIDTVKEAGDIFNKRLDFRVDEDTHRIVVKVIDNATDKVIKEIPPEQLVELAAKIQEMVGLLVDEER